MDNKNDFNKIGYVNRGRGIPKYPAEYKFHMDESVEFTKVHEEARRKKLSKFLAQYGLELVE